MWLVRIYLPVKRYRCFNLGFQLGEARRNKDTNADVFLVELMRIPLMARKAPVFSSWFLDSILRK